MNPSDLVNFLGALAGIGAVVIAWWKLRRVDEARLGFESRDALIDQLQEEYGRLTEQVSQLSEKLDATEDNLEEAERKHGVLQQRVTELVEENHKLHQYIGALQERTKHLPEEALAQMRDIAVKVAELNSCIRETCDDGPAVELVDELLELVAGIPALIEG